jgi:ABC-type dipeptide/oligopeptide/nickel transport system ATPase component
VAIILLIFLTSFLSSILFVAHDHAVSRENCHTFAMRRQCELVA